MTNYDELVKRLREPLESRTKIYRVAKQLLCSGLHKVAHDYFEKIASTYDGQRSEAADAVTRLQADLKEAVEIISWFIENDETNEGDEPLESKNGATWNEINAYWIGGLNRGRDFIAKHEGKKG